VGKITNPSQITDKHNVVSFKQWSKAEGACRYYAKGYSCMLSYYYLCYYSPEL